MASRRTASWSRPDDGLVLRAGAAVRPDAARPRLHQGLSAGHPGEWRPVHPCGHLGGAGLRRPGRRRPGGDAVRACSTRSTARCTPADVDRSRSSRTPSWPTSIPCRPMSAAAAGPGTPARPAGCSGRGSRASSASASAAPRCTSSRASRGTGRASRRRSPGAPPATASWSRTRPDLARASRRSRSTARASAAGPLALVDDGATHIVEVRSLGAA